MKVTTFQGNLDLLVTTVILHHNKRKNLDLFRCSHCGRGAGHNSGDIIASFPGMMPSKDVFTGFRCIQSNCRQFYMFQTETIPKPEYAQISLLFRPGMKSEDFDCFVCGHQVISYTHEMIFDPTNKSKQAPPYKTKCPHKTCGKKYEFIEILTVEET